MTTFLNNRSDRTGAKTTPTAAHRDRASRSALERLTAAVDTATRDRVDDLILRIFEKTASQRYNSSCPDEDDAGEALMDRCYDEQYESASVILSSGSGGIAAYLLDELGLAPALEALRIP